MSNFMLGMFALSSTSEVWIHISAEFRAAFESIGFEIMTDQKTYRNARDLIVSRKPVVSDSRN
jgi:hypothetical protein